jgi:hypothetical protein
MSTDLYLIAMTYCRVYLNRQTAAAHQLAFQQIEAIVKQDTGESLKWRHLHANSPNELLGILQWAGDQHRGQAKGDDIYAYVASSIHSVPTRSWPSPSSSRRQVTLAK